MVAFEDTKKKKENEEENNYKKKILSFVFFVVPLRLLFTSYIIADAGEAIKEIQE